MPWLFLRRAAGSGRSKLLRRGKGVKRFSSLSREVAIEHKRSIHDGFPPARTWRAKKSRSPRKTSRTMACQGWKRLAAEGPSRAARRGWPRRAPRDPSWLPVHCPSRPRTNLAGHKRRGASGVSGATRIARRVPFPGMGSRQRVRGRWGALFRLCRTPYLTPCPRRNRRACRPGQLRGTRPSATVGHGLGGRERSLPRCVAFARRSFLDEEKC